MNPEQPAYNPKTRVSNELSVMQPGEATICNVKRHPIGILGIYFIVGLLILVLAVLAFAVVPSLFSDNDSAGQMALAIFFILAVVMGLYSLIATKVYWGNSWVVTSDSITQINQRSLFGRESSQLGLESLEDITVEQNGVLAHMFNYGVLKAETAGHHSKFVFLYCPNPNFYAQQILQAREAYTLREQHGYRTTYEPPQPPA